MPERFFDKVYEARTPDETRAVYDRFAETYEAEVADHGYATPGRLARALAAVTPDRERPVLDFGCGTGLSGAALAAEGFTAIDGADLSAPMLAVARTRGLYRTLTHLQEDNTLDAFRGRYRAIVACGVIGAGAAPLAVLDSIAGLLDRGGRLAFSLNDHTLEDPSYEARVAGMTADGWRSLVREYGPHLPGLGLNSVIHILEKT